VIVGSHAGVSVGPDGGTHQAIEDIALMRVLPNMVVVAPCDSIEAKKATLALAQSKEPAYLRLAREKTAIITTDETPFEIGKAQVFYKSEIRNPKSETNSKSKNQNGKVGIIGTGSLLHKALVAAKELDAEGIAVTVLNLSTIKPLDENSILELAKECGRIVTVEEHQIAGGVGSAVAEFLARTYPTPIEFVGVKDLFGQSGSPEQILQHYGMMSEDIKKAARAVSAR
jgi:transketolase